LVKIGPVFLAKEVENVKSFQNDERTDGKRLICKAILPVLLQTAYSHFLFFLCFASVQNCQTYPPARGKNKQALKNSVSACCMDVKYNQKMIYFFLSAKEILNKV
jgi:hypothetical protein